jgi:UDP-glucose 4-epimerase
MAKKIIVTGGAGYIGSHIIIELIQQTDHEVISVDNFCNSDEHTFERIEKITGKKIKNYNIDLRDLKKTEGFFASHKDSAAIIHLAALKSVPESVADPILYYDNNINSLLNIIQCQLKFNIQNLIFSSSCSVYGNINDLPVKEETVLNKAESPYGYTKQIGERIIEDVCKSNKNLNCILLRYFNPVGAHISGLNGELPINAPTNLVPVITQTAIGKIPKTTVFGGDYPTRDGTCIRDYIHVSDIANAHLLALQNLLNKKNKSNHSIYNLGSGKGVSVLEAIKAFETTSGQKLNYTIGPRREGDVIAVYSDSSKVEKELGWKPVYSLDQMVETAWKWQQNLEK